MSGSRYHDVTDRDNLEELAILDSLGMLERNEQKELEKLMERADDETRFFMERYRDVAAAIGFAETPVEPPAEIRNRVLEATAAEEFNLISSSEGWKEHALEGVRYKTLHRGEARVSLLVEMAPGAEFPHHEHADNEECYVISGFLQEGEQLLETGDFLFASAGTDHGPLKSPQGCTVLLGLSHADYQSMTG